MKRFFIVAITSLAFTFTSCLERPKNTSAIEEQVKTEINQRDLNTVQPAPKISWSLERDNLIKRFKLQNDRTVMFYMYLFIEGIADPIGFYQVNKVSSVNSQLTNTSQIVSYSSPNLRDGYGQHILPSPAEDGSYGTNGDAVFGFTPEEIYIESNLKYVVSTVPLNFNKVVNRLAIIKDDEARALLEKTKISMNKK